MNQFNVQIGFRQCCMDYYNSQMEWKKTYVEKRGAEIKNSYSICLKT
jgi:hypothetical protein